MPSILKDGPKFFPNVLSTQTFQIEGILWGQESYGVIGLHWVVIDPRRHTMYVWEKSQDDFVQAAYSLNASQFSNGSFNDYKGGNKYVATAKVYLGTCYDHFKSSIRRMDVIRPFNLKSLRSWGRYFQKRAARHWAGHRAHGNIFGVREGISIVGKSRPQQHYFGRKQGRFFSDYQIGQGSPGGPNTAGGFSEVIGALFRTVDNYNAVDPQKQGIGTGHYGLAPLIDTNGKAADSILKGAGIEDAMKKYHEKETEYNSSDKPEGYNPPAKNAPNCTGLILAAFYWGTIIQKELAAIRVKDAVRVDGNNSILLGYAQNAVVGANMPVHKRFYNKWGYQFQSG